MKITELNNGGVVLLKYVEIDSNIIPIEVLQYIKILDNAIKDIKKNPYPYMHLDIEVIEKAKREIKEEIIKDNK